MAAMQSVKKLQKRLANAQNNSKRLRMKAREGLETVLRSGEVCGAAFAFGVVKGRTGDTPSIAGVPLDLALGITGHGLAILGLGGGMDAHMRSLADGALSSYVHTMGVDIGAKMAAKSGALAPGQMSGYLDEGEQEVAGGYGLSEAELAAYNL